MRRLKILLSAYACEPGKGSEPEVGWQWAVHLARHHDVTVLTRSNNEPAIRAGLEAIQPGDRPRFIYHDLGAGWRFLKKRLGLFQAFYWMWQRTARSVVARHVATEHFDILHHLTFVSFRHTTAIWGHGVPTVWGPIGGIESVPWRLLPPDNPAAYFSEALRNLLNRFGTSPFAPARRRGRESDLVLGASPQVADYFRSTGSNVKLLPAIGIDTPPSLVPREQDTAAPLRLIYCGRMLWWKGLTFMLHALREADDTTTVTLIGDGPLLPVLRKIVARFGLNDRVHFRGRLNLAESLASYEDHDALIFPSFHDSGGFTVLEAMARGLPVICLDAGGPALSVEPGTGVKVKAFGQGAIIAGLVAAIRRYAADRALLAAEGAAAHAAVIEKHTWERRTESALDAYRYVLGKA